jgi:hypothetical protein
VIHRKNHVAGPILKDITFPAILPACAFEHCWLCHGAHSYNQTEYCCEIRNSQLAMIPRFRYVHRYSYFQALQSYCHGTVTSRKYKALIFHKRIVLHVCYSSWKQEYHRVQSHGKTHGNWRQGYRVT